MAPYKSPLADPTVVNKISTDVKKLSNESVDIEERVAKAKREAADVFQKYGSDFGILGEVPPFFDQYAAKIGSTNNKARDVAKKISSEYDDFVLIIEIVVEKITTKEKLKEAVEALKDTLKTQNPLVSSPLDGFQGVTNEFNYIWSLKVDETKHIIDVLEAAVDIKKTIEELTKALKPVKEGAAKVQQALNDYASHIQN